MRDKMFKDLAKSLGMPYTASTDWVDLYYDGVYRGTYIVSEKNSVNKTGVNITDMEKAYEACNPGYGENASTALAENKYGQTYQYTTGLTEPENITGGYLLELNGTKLDDSYNPKYDEAQRLHHRQGLRDECQEPRVVRQGRYGLHQRVLSGV